MAETILVCGIDEAGRGPLAGPVCAAAVILESGFKRGLLNDSKKLTAARREELRPLIQQGALAWGIGWASHTEIDSINILRASLLAMKRAFEEMTRYAREKRALPPGVTISVIVDGNHVPEIMNAAAGSLPFPVQCEALVKADAKIPEVMAASILAKTARDSYMDEMEKLYPQYDYSRHKGYPTKAHKELLRQYGPSPIQRKSFRY